MCKVLQYQGKHDILRCLNETSHVVLHNRLTALSNCDSTDQVLNSSNNSSDLLINTGANYKHQISIKDNILKCYSDMCLKRNPRMFAPVTPIKNEFSNKNNTHLTAIELKRKETDLSLPVTLKYYYKNSSKSTHSLDLNTPYCEKHIMTNMKNDKINKKRIVDINTNVQKQTQITKSKSSVILYIPLDITTTDAKIVEIDKCVAKSNYNSIFYTNSCFTNKEIVM